MPPIPPFTSDGLLPPYLGASPVESGLMSPYRVTVSEFVAHFGTSASRLAILEGFLRYRSDLHAFGLTAGLQWLDGSFVERLEGAREPRDVDVVTFFHRPPSMSDDAALMREMTASLHLFSSKLAKVRYKCDVYFVDLNQPAESIVAQTRYWFGLFSHRRSTFQWKGMLEVQLGTLADDQDAANMLNVGASP